MKLNLFTVAASAAVFAASVDAARMPQTQATGESFTEMIDSLALSQSEAATMSEAEIQARAEAITDLFLENAVESEVSAEARAEAEAMMVGALTSGITAIAGMVIPAIIGVIGMKLISPWLC